MFNREFIADKLQERRLKRNVSNAWCSFVDTDIKYNEGKLSADVRDYELEKHNQAKAALENFYKSRKK